MLGDRLDVGQRVLDPVIELADQDLLRVLGLLARRHIMRRAEPLQDLDVARTRYLNDDAQVWVPGNRMRDGRVTASTGNCFAKRCLEPIEDDGADRRS